MNPHKPAPTAAPELRTIVTDVLGDLAFMISDEEVAEFLPGAIWLEGEIRYVGPTQGSVRAWCTREFAIRLAANLLGIEAGVGEAQVAADDALREFLNVLCGHLVTETFGTESVFELTIASVNEGIDPPPETALSGGSVCQLSIEGEPFVCVHQPD